ncbi:MAG: 1,4-alpha-glucan branching protein GlgB [Lachnospiraceae bacterium]
MNRFISEEEIDLFNRGSFYNSYLRFGAHCIQIENRWGVHFAVWAPHAKAVNLVGDFNGWNEESHPMQREKGGVWCIFIENLSEGALYKYRIETQEGESLYKSDPYAFYSELRPKTASIVYSLDHYNWQDRQWKKDQKKYIPRKGPMLIYEVHVGSWKRREDGSMLSYVELAEQLVPYVKEMGYTHIEFMPLSEHPFDGSWGYQTTGYYSATSRYGTPEELMYLIDCCHQNKIGVIMDWVPGHFCKDAHGLGLFDGTALYEKEVHLQWGTYKFNFAQKEVNSFLISNALFWFDQFHFDGLRMDGVSSMLFLDFDRKDGYVPNRYGGRENLEAIDFVRKVNRVVLESYPQAMMIAEESTDWPMVTKPGYDGGLGFTFKWNMGWMNDLLKYSQLEYEQREQNQNLLTFSLMYAFSEEFILPFSHDEVVHGKHSLVDRQPGDNWKKFAGYRALFLYQMTHPGKKLTFMGNEIAQYIEWRYDESLEWFLLDYPLHAGFQEFVKACNKLYGQEKALWQQDSSMEGFLWCDADNKEQSVISFERRDEKKGLLLVVINFKPQAYNQFRIGVSAAGNYHQLLNSDSSPFGGAGYHENTVVKSEPVPFHGKECSVVVKLPPLGGLIFKCRHSRKKT